MADFHGGEIGIRRDRLRPRRPHRRVRRSRRLHHLRGQRQLIGRKLEQRVGRHEDLVIEEVFVDEAEPYRLAVGDEVDAVAPLRQGLAQLGSHDARAAESRVTDNADVHIRGGAAGERREGFAAKPPNGRQVGQSREKYVGLNGYVIQGWLG